MSEADPSAQLRPTLGAHVLRRQVGEQTVLVDPRTRARLPLATWEVAVVDAMDGTRALEALERAAEAARGQVAWSALVTLLYRLWDRGMLDQGEAIRSALFPEMELRTIDRALAWRRVRWFFGAGWTLRAFAGAGASLAGVGRVLAGTPMLAAMAVCAVVGVGLWASGVVQPTLFNLGEDWGLGVLVAWAAGAGALSARGVARWAVLSAYLQRSVAPELRHAAAVPFIDVDDGDAFHLPSAPQIRLGLVGLLVPAALGGEAALGVALGGPAWLAHVATACGVIVFVDLCPFLPTSGARLLERLSRLDRQRLRVRGFIGGRLLRGLGRTDAAPEERAFHLVASAWIAWFLFAVQVFSALVVDQLVPLQVAIIASGSAIVTGLGALLFVWTICMVLVLLGTMLVVITQLMGQLVRWDRVSRPSQRQSASSLASSERGRIAVALGEAPLLGDLDVGDRGALVDRMERLSFSGGRFVLRRGRAERRVFVVRTGAVELLRPLADGRYERVAKIGPGSLLGLDAVHDLPSQHDARCLDDTELLALDLTALRAALTSDVAGLLERARFLDGVPELAGLGASGRLALAASLKDSQWGAGDMVVRQGDVGQSMFLIREGQCAVSRDDVVVATLAAGHAFGEIGLLLRRPRTATVRCVTPARLYEVSADAFSDAVRRSFQVGLAVERLARARVDAA